MSTRAISVVAAFLMLGGLCACWSDLSMIWDGAYQFCYTLIEQRAYFHETRFHSWIVWQPVLWLSTQTQDLGLLRFVYGLPYCMAPALGFILSWWVTRRHAPHLLLWAAFGTAAAMLPGQVFIINDSIFQIHLFWPLFLGLMVPLRPIQRAVLAVLAIFQLSHPIGMVLCGGAAVVLALLAFEVHGDGRRTFVLRAAVMTALAVIGFLKVVLFPDPYAASEFTVGAARTLWEQGVGGFPIAGWVCMILGGGLLYLMASSKTEHRDKYGSIALGCILGGAAIWLFWAADPERWVKALDYRRFVVPLSVPFFALAWLEMRGRCRLEDSKHLQLRNTIACIVAAVFAGVLGLQSTQWKTLHTRLFLELEARPEVIVQPVSFPWLQATALNHWGITALPMAHGITDKFLVEAAQVEILQGVPPRVPLSFFRSYLPEPGPGGWFDFREAMALLQKENQNGDAVNVSRAVLKWSKK